MSETIYSDKIKVSCPLVCDDSGYFHLVYQITNLVNGKVYVGKHSTKDPYDSYMGSGINIVRAIEKYGVENFTKEILFCFDKEEIAFLKEAEIVNLEFINREDTYNIVVGGNMIAGSWSGERNPMYGKSPSQETRDKMSKSRKGLLAGEKHPMYGMTGEKNPFYGKHHTQEAKDRISKANSGENSWWYGKHGEENPNFGKKHTKEHNEKISKALTGEKNPFYGKHHTEQTRELMRKNHADFSGKNNPNYGRRFSDEIRERMSNAHKGIQAGAKNPKAKAVLKLDEFDNIITEYGCIKDCCEQEGFTYKILLRIIKNHDSYNEFFFRFNPKD